ncbi:MAG: hypothetical protein AAF430_14845 [Myxococcota bacterium]
MATLTWACASNPAPVEVQVENRSGFAVDEIRATPCEGTTGRTLTASPLQPGERRWIAVPRTCVHLEARTQDHVSAERRSFVPLPGSFWAIDPRPHHTGDSG